MAVDGGRVIAGVSGSLRSLGALRAGVDEARQTGAPLMAVLAWVPAGGELAYRRAPCPVLLKLWEQAARRAADRCLRRRVRRRSADVTVRGMVVRGRPGPFLVELADQPDDLLVVGGGGRKLAASSVHGSVTRYCMAHAHCPVLTVPPPELITAGAVTSAPLAARGLRRATRRRARPRHRPPEAPRRAATVTSERPSERSAADLPAYRGAPYLPARSSPSGRTGRSGGSAWRCILITAMLLVALTGVLLAQSLP